MIAHAGRCNQAYSPATWRMSNQRTALAIYGAPAASILTWLKNRLLDNEFDSTTVCLFVRLFACLDACLAWLSAAIPISSSFRGHLVPCHAPRCS